MKVLEKMFHGGEPSKTLSGGTYAADRAVEIIRIVATLRRIVKINIVIFSLPVH